MGQEIDHQVYPHLENPFCATVLKRLFTWLPSLENPFCAAVLKRCSTRAVLTLRIYSVQQSLRSAPPGLSSPWESILCSSPEEVLHQVYPHLENPFCAAVLKECSTWSILTLRIHSVQQSWRGAPPGLSSPWESILCSSPEDVQHMFCPHLENPFCAAVLKMCTTCSVLT